MVNDNIHAESACDVCGLPAAGPSQVVVVPGYDMTQVIHMTYDPTPKIESVIAEIDSMKRSVEMVWQAVLSTVPPEMVKQINAKVREYLSLIDSEGGRDCYPDAPDDSR
jgi:hypothetical protein